MAKKLTIQDTLKTIIQDHDIKIFIEQIENACIIKPKG